MSAKATNNAEFRWQELDDILSGEWLLLPDSEKSGRGTLCVSDDSRHVVPGALFIAIKGELADGHNYLSAAVKAGASAVVVSDRLNPDQEVFFRKMGVGVRRVADTLVAFHALGRAHRRRMASLRVVGVTGSCGKTSTKEMLAAVLERHWPDRVLKTEGNTNNHFGVPRNLLRLIPEHSAAVIEMGTNHPGEIARLAKTVEPDVGLVSNIGHAHLEFFRDLSGVAREKGDLLAGTRPGGWTVFPHNAPSIDILCRKASGHPILTFGDSSEADIQAVYRGKIREGCYAVDLTVHRTSEKHQLRWGIGGAHQAMNAAAAVAVAHAMGIGLSEAIAGLANCQLPHMRMETKILDGVSWINDAYNANPDSMRAAIEWFAEECGGAKSEESLLVLGDMLELGDESSAAHSAILAFAAKTVGRSRVIAVGNEMRAAAKGEEIAWYAGSTDARDDVRMLARTCRSVMIKGSRGVQLETVLPDNFSE